VFTPLVGLALASFSLLHPLLRSPAHRPPDSPFNQRLHLSTVLVYLGKHEALERGVHPIDLDRAGHARCELVAVAEELLHDRLIVADLTASLFDPLHVDVVGEAPVVHDMVECGRRGGFGI